MIRTRALRCLALAGLLIFPTMGTAVGGEVLLASGRTLEVEWVEAREEAMFLHLPGGGMVAVRADHVQELRGVVPTAEFPSAPAQVSAPEPHPSAPSQPGPGQGLESLILDASTRHGVDPLLVRAVIQVESAWNPRAVSPKGAKGLMQLMPATARFHGVTDPFDPTQNVEAGTQELANHLDRHSGEISLALAAYNAGPTAVARYQGIPPYRETLDYVDRVLDLYFRWAGETGTP